MYHRGKFIGTVHNCLIYRNYKTVMHKIRVRFPASVFADLIDCTEYSTANKSYLTSLSFKLFCRNALPYLWLQSFSPRNAGITFKGTLT